MIGGTNAASLYVPSPTQIREECREIRREWSIRERVFRRTDGRKVWRLIVAPHPRFDRRQHSES
jgi:hypothetical protein